MNILYASNDGYARHLGVSLYSLLEHNKKAEMITVYILSVNLSVDNQEKLQRIGRQFGRSIHMVEMGDLEERFTVPIDTRGFDISAMTRLFAAEALPETVKKVLYLDCDTVVIGDIRPLWKTRMEGNLVAMVPEPTVYQEMKASIDLGKDDAYYNSGVLLMDLEAWRSEDIQRKLFQYYADKGGNLFACDQDTINGALKGRIRELSPRYNFFTNYRYFHYKTLVGMNRSYERIGKQEFEVSKRRPVILHYMGDERPWVAGNHNHYRKYYESYLARTPWQGTPKEHGKEGYMLVYRGMNYVTWLCPPLRLWISRHFGMRVIDARKADGAGKPTAGQRTGKSTFRKNKR